MGTNQIENTFLTSLFFLSLVSVTFSSANFYNNTLDASNIKPINNFSDEKFFLNIPSSVTTSNKENRKDIQAKIYQGKTTEISQPSKFINSIDSKRHIILVSDDANEQKNIEFEFIKYGLENKERCIYLTHGDPNLIEKDMQSHEIDVESYKKNGMLLVNHAPNITDSSENTLDLLEKLFYQTLGDPKIRTRAVGRMMPDVSYETSMSVQLYIEKTFCRVFDEMNCSVLCTYDFSQIKENNMWREWLDKLESYHHIVISHIKGKTVIRYPMQHQN